RITPKPSAATDADELVAACPQVNRGRGQCCDQSDDKDASHTEVLSANGSTLRLGAGRVNDDGVWILCSLYRGLSNESHGGDASPNRSSPSLHRPPRSRTSDVTTVPPSALMLRPFTGLLTAGEAPRSATTRAFPVRTSSATSESRNCSVSRIPKTRDPSFD